MTNHADLIAALRIPMNVTLRKGAPELDEYDEQRISAADAIEAVLAEAYRRGQEDMRERAALVCTETIRDYYVMSPDKKSYAPLKTQRAAKGMVSLAREDIRALAIKEKDNG